MTYHYRECGLDNVYINDGFIIERTAYGEGVAIEDSAGLHRRIARALVDSVAALNGAELRFLRKVMDLGQGALAADLGTTEQTLRLWEKHRDKPIPAMADRLLRAIFREFATGMVSVRRLLGRIDKLANAPRQPIVLSRGPRGWRTVAGRMAAE